MEIRGRRKKTEIKVLLFFRAHISLFRCFNKAVFAFVIYQKKIRAHFPPKRSLWAHRRSRPERRRARLEIRCRFADAQAGLKALARRKHRARNAL